MDSYTRSFAMGIIAFFATSVFLLLSDNIQASDERAVDKEKDKEKALESALYLEKKVDKLLEATDEQLAFFDEKYDELYDSELKKIYQHITFSDRLVSNSKYFIRDNPVQVNNRKSAINLDLRSRSALTAYEIDEFILKDTNLYGLGEAFIQAEIDYNINAFFLVSLAIHESNWGRSKIAVNKNNLFGYGAYDSSPYKSAVYFPNKSVSIDRVAQSISNSYLNSDGKYFGGGYTLRHVNKRYSTDSKWSSKIAASMDYYNQKIISMQDLAYVTE